MWPGMSFGVLIFASLLTATLSGWAAPMENTAKISLEERQHMSENAAIRTQRAYAPARARVAKFLASDAQVETSCPTCGDKDFSDLCPLGWTELTDGRCAAPKTYAGTCSDKQIFLGTSVAEKMEAEISCGICWPCARGGEDTSATCTRDWVQPCPNGYNPQDISHSEFSDTSGVTCLADLTYEGECEQQVVFNDARAKQEFAERCQTSWPCLSACEGDGCPGSASAPLRSSSQSETAGSGHHLKATSFLAARVLPVDAYKIRNSLFLSQLLRMLAAAAVNVVEQEDSNRIYEEAKYKSMEGQASRLDRAMETKFRLLAQKA